MSEPMSTPEIEDVVSSVRRLVSTTLSPRVKTRDLAYDRLILTPSLRVVPEVSPEVLPEPVADLVTELAAEPVAEPVAEMPVVDKADPATAVPEAPFIDVELAEGRLDATLHLVDAEWEDELWTEAESPLAELAEEVEDAEIVAEAAAVADPWPEAAVEAEPWEPTETEWVEEAPIPFVPLHRDATATDPAVAVVVEPVAADPGPADAVPPGTEDPARSTLFDQAGNPISILDEDELSEVVRNLIREELQGALGERITSNVRKLVRAEINRALAARAFE